MVNLQEVSGWALYASIIYATAWCLSFYAQIYQNYRLKSVQGYSLSYFALTFTAYIYYAIYLSLGCFTDYTGAGTIVLADMVFIYHAVAMMIILLIQCIIYQKGGNKLAGSAIIIIIVITDIIFVVVILAFTQLVAWYQYWNPLVVIGYTVIILTFITSIPQIYWNFERKSTKGWSIVAVSLYLVGGPFCFSSGWVSVTNGLNFVKVILGFISLIYSLIFFVQFYVLNREVVNLGKSEKSQSLDVAVHLISNNNEGENII